jgi:hypothetical protein
MKLFFQSLGVIACGFGWVWMKCFMSFFCIFGISARKSRLTPVTIALIPFGLVLLCFGFPFYLISALVGEAASHGLGTFGTPQELGIRLTNRAHRVHRLLGWTDINELRQGWEIGSPSPRIRAVLHSGEIVSIDFIKINTLATALEQRGIPFIVRDIPVGDHESEPNQTA